MNLGVPHFPVVWHNIGGTTGRGKTGQNSSVLQGST